MKIATVMVTFNRLNDLKRAINTYENQTYLPYHMIIVNNSSTDGTGEFLDEWKNKPSCIKKTVINLPQNIGGSGGFYTGLEYAQSTDAEWYWVADDDAFLELTVFEKFNKFVANHPEIAKNASALCSSVLDNEATGRISYWHRRRTQVVFGCPKENVPFDDDYKKEFFEIDLFTFVGALIKAEISKKVGLPQKDFFIYHDDIEYSYRISKEGMLYCVPDVIVYHNAGTHEKPYGSDWRSYYMSRNWLLYYKWHFPVAYYKVVIKRYLQRLILRPLHKYKPKNQLDYDAMLDAKKEKMGISEKYYIGWKLNE